MSAPIPVITAAPEIRHTARLAYEYRSRYFAKRIARAFEQLKETLVFSRTAEG